MLWNVLYREQNRLNKSCAPCTIHILIEDGPPKLAWEEIIYMLPSFCGQRISTVRRKKRIIDIRCWAYSLQISFGKKGSFSSLTFIDKKVQCTQLGCCPSCFKALHQSQMVHTASLGRAWSDLVLTWSDQEVAHAHHPRGSRHLTFVNCVQLLNTPNSKMKTDNGQTWVSFLRIMATINCTLFKLTIKLYL